jgi:hypothetical protein
MHVRCQPRLSWLVSVTLREVAAYVVGIWMRQINPELRRIDDATC